MPAVNANGITIEYESLGAAEAPAIFLIMGLGMQLTAWPDPFCEALFKQGFRVIRFDNRDIGLSSKMEGLGVPNLAWASVRSWLGLSVHSGYLLSDMAADTVGLMDALGIRAAHVVGVSMGGMIAQMVAALYPQRTSSLTSIMSTTGSTHLPRPSGEVVKTLLSRPTNPRDPQSVVDHYMKLFGVIGSPGFPIEETELRQRLEKSVLRSYYPAGSARQLLAIIASGDRTRLLATIKAPTLVIHGVNDPLIPVEAGKDTAAKITGAKLQLVQGMGHDMAAWPLLAEAIVSRCRHAW
jgi:pimeloyl-ACP methyl ester carboxylesterase